MTKNVKVVTENETMRQACKLMYQHNIGSIVILKEGIPSNTARKETPVGIVTERDITRMMGFSAKSFGDMPVSEAMSKPLITANSYTSVKDAVALMEQKNIRRLPVVDEEGQMVGIITAKDILKAAMNIFKKDMKDQDLIPEGFDLLGLLGAE